MKSQHTYLFLDFETTGLDIQKDLPIQVALIKTDQDFEVQKSYSSYISLPSGSDGLKANISYITGIHQSVLETHGKDTETIREEIQEFFDENTILIGQNISFDIGFLKKYFPGCEFYDSVDTYILACSTIPYLQSYSLESIDQYLTKKDTPSRKRKKSLLASLSGDKAISNHDALYDCIVGLVFTQRCMTQVQNFSEEFPILQEAIGKLQSNNFSLLSDLKNTSSETIKKIQKSSLPLLSSPVKSEKKSNYHITTNRSKVPSESKFSTKGLSKKEIIQELPEKSIIAVSHGSKIDIIRHALPGESFGYLKADQTIDHKKLSQRLSKDHFSEEEVLFIVFYLAHHRDGYRVLDPKISTHKYILDYLQADELSSPAADKRILCTLGGLYYTLEQKERRQKEFSDYTICILDADRRHTSYNNFAQKGLKLEHTPSTREKELYKLKQEHNEEQIQAFEKILNLWILWLGYFGIESDNYLQNLQRKEISYFPQEAGYEKTSGLRENLKEERKSYVKLYSNNQEITSLIHKINQFLLHPVVVRRHISHQGESSYSIAPSVRYIDFAEYLELFGDQKILFFSPRRTDYQQWIIPSAEKKSGPKLFENQNSAEIVDTIKASGGLTFIVSHNGAKSKKLFEHLTQEGLDTVATLIGEHITGGVGKAVTQYDDSGDTIAIGGYHLLLQFWASGKTFDTIIIYSVYQSLAEVLVDDIKFYAPIRKS